MEDNERRRRRTPEIGLDEREEEEGEEEIINPRQVTYAEVHAEQENSDKRSNGDEEKRSIARESITLYSSEGEPVTIEYDVDQLMSEWSPEEILKILEGANSVEGMESGDGEVEGIEKVVGESSVEGMKKAGDEMEGMENVEGGWLYEQTEDDEELIRAVEAFENQQPSIKKIKLN